MELDQVRKVRGKEEKAGAKLLRVTSSSGAQSDTLWKWSVDRISMRDWIVFE